MPANNGFQLDDSETGSPVRPALREPNPEVAIALPQPRPVRSPLQDCELVAKRKILGRQPRSVTEDAPHDN